MFGNSLGDAKFLIINPGHYKAFSTVIDPTVPIPPADAAPPEREGGGGLGHWLSRKEDGDQAPGSVSAAAGGYRSAADVVKYGSSIRIQN